VTLEAVLASRCGQIRQQRTDCQDRATFVQDLALRIGREREGQSYQHHSPSCRPVRTREAVPDSGSTAHLPGGLAYTCAGSSRGQ